MALKDAFVNIASAQASKIAGGVVGGITSGLFGSNRPQVRGKATKGGPSPSKFSTKMLMYPTDVAEDPMQGHYIMFSARVNDGGSLKKSTGTSSRDAQVRSAVKKRNDINDVENDESTLGTLSLTPQDRAVLTANDRRNHGVGKSLSSKRLGNSRVASTISLYMPPQVTVAYANKFGEQEIGYLAAAGQTLIGEVEKIAASNFDFSVDGATAIAKKFGTAVVNTANVAGNTAFAGARELGIKAIDGIAPGARALIALETGRVKTPHMELMFEGVARRTFTYAFIFIPKSRQESENVKDIIDTFKKHMTPDFSGGKDSSLSKLLGTSSKGVTATQQFRSMDIPDTFQINYMYRTQENEYINKISDCYLQQMDVSYGGDKFSAHDSEAGGTPGAPPSRISVNLTFQELDIVDRGMVEEGF